jgi:hypothetical protein
MSFTYNQYGAPGVKGTATFPQPPTRVYGTTRLQGANISVVNPQTLGMPDLNFRQVRSGAYKFIMNRNSYQQVLRPLI